MRCTTDTSEDTRYVYANSEYGQLQVECTEVLRSTCTCMHTSFVVKFKNFGMFVMLLTNWVYREDDCTSA